MKIAFIGAHGTGKTTLAKEIAQRLQLPFISETAREIKDEYALPLFPNTTQETQLLIFLRQLDKELKYKSGVFDRCLLDNIAYSINVVSGKLLDYMLCSALMLTAEFDLIFLVTRFSDMIKSDGYRDIDLQGQMDIEHRIVNLLQEHNIRYYLIHERDEQDRVAKVMEVIMAYKTKHEYDFDWEDEGCAQLAYFKCICGNELCSINNETGIDEIGLLQDQKIIQCPYCNRKYKCRWKGMIIERFK